MCLRFVRVAGQHLCALSTARTSGSQPVPGPTQRNKFQLCKLGRVILTSASKIHISAVGASSPELDVMQMCIKRWSQCWMRLDRVGGFRIDIGRKGSGT